MPHTTNTPITPRQQIDSSQSANVALPAVASQADVAGYGSGMFGVSRALNSLAATVGNAAEIKRRAAERQDTKDGKAAAAEKAVTGAAPDLTGMSDTFVKSYQETDGLRTAGDFENQLIPKLAKLEPGQDVDQFIQDQANEFVGSANMPEATTKAFMVAVSGKQDQWKQGYLKQSIAESLHREEESFGAIAADQFQKGILATPEGLKSFQTLAGHRGLTAEETNGLLVSAAASVLATGKGDAQAIRSVLGGIKVGEDGGTLGNVPEFKEKLDLAQKRGAAVQEQGQKKAQEADLTQSLFHLSDRADLGILGDREIEATRVKYSLTPEWATGMHNRNREAQEKAAKQNAANDIKRQARHLAYAGSPLEIEAFGRRHVEEASGELLHEAVQTGNWRNVERLATAMSKNGTPWPAMKSVLDSINTADTKRATQLAHIFETVASVSPDYANQLVSSDTKAKLDRYLRETRVYGADPAQAWETVRNAQTVEPQVLSPEMAKLWKDKQGDVPTDFDDTASFNPFTSDTKIQNQAQVKSEVYRLTRELLGTGQYGDDPSKAFDAAVEKYKGTHVRVGNRYVPTFGTTEHVEPQTAQAMTDYSASYRNKLASEGVIGKEDEVWFSPDPNSPGKWTAYEMVGGVPFPLAKDGQVVQVNPNAVRVNHTAWKAQEDKKHKVLTQGLDRLGYGKDALDDGGAAGLLKRLNTDLSTPYKPHGDGKTDEAFYKNLHDTWAAKATEARPLIEQHMPQDFLDFIHSTQ